MQRMLTLSANIYGEDLGRAAARVQQAINDTGKPPDRVNVTVPALRPPTKHARPSLNQSCKAYRGNFEISRCPLRQDQPRSVCVAAGMETLVDRI
jgi:hypothetical protein